MLPVIWLYWEKDPTKKTPVYIDICRRSVFLKNKRSFSIKIVTPHNLHRYLPYLRNDIFSLPRIAQRADYIRFSLLGKYGGIWLDSDTICLKDLSGLFSEFQDSNFDFAATSHYGIGKPTIGIMLAKERSTLVEQQVLRMDQALDKIDNYKNLNWSFLGADLLWKIANQKNYLHLPVKKLSPVSHKDYHLFFKPLSINEFVDSNTYTFSLFNEMFRLKRPEVMSLSKIALLKKDWLISQALMRGLI